MSASETSEISTTLLEALQKDAAVVSGGVVAGGVGGGGDGDVAVATAFVVVVAVVVAGAGIVGVVGVFFMTVRVVLLDSLNSLGP